MKNITQSPIKLTLAAVVASLAVAAPASAQVDATAETRDASVAHSDQGIALDTLGLGIRSSQNGISVTSKTGTVQLDGDGLHVSLAEGRVAAGARTGTRRGTARTRSTAGKVRNRAMRGAVKKIAGKASARVRVSTNG